MKEFLRAVNWFVFTVTDSDVSFTKIDNFHLKKFWRINSYTPVVQEILKTHRLFIFLLRGCIVLCIINKLCLKIRGYILNILDDLEHNLKIYWSNEISKYQISQIKNRAPHIHLSLSFIVNQSLPLVNLSLEPRVTQASETGSPCQPEEGTSKNYDSPSDDA